MIKTAMNSAALQRALALWQNLTPRERWLAAVGAACLALLLVYALLWLPLQRNLVRLRAEVPKAHEQLQWMRTQAPQAQAQRTRPPAPLSAGALQTAVDQSATVHGLKPHLSRLEVDGTGTLRLALDAVPFNTLVSWLADLQKTHALVIVEAVFEAHSTTGWVNARLQLRRSAP